MMKSLLRKTAAMQPNITYIDFRPHPLDPARIGPQGLTALLFGKFEEAVNDIALVSNYAAMTSTLLDMRDQEVVRA